MLVAAPCSRALHFLASTAFARKPARSGRAKPLNMSFWGAEVVSGKVASWVPPPDPARLHLSQVVYGASHTSVLFIALECKTQDMGPFRLAIVSRTEKPGPSVSLDLIFDQYTEFTLVPLDATLQPCNQSSGFSVHLTGYHMPIEEEPELDEEDEEDPELTSQEMSALRRQFAQGGMLGGDDEESEDEDGEHGFGMPGSSESEDYDDSISEDDDDEFEPERARSHVLIEDVTDLPATHLPEELPARSRLSLLGAPEAATAPASVPEGPTAASHATENGAKPLTKAQKKAAKRKAKAAQDAAPPSENGLGPSTSTPASAAKSAPAATPAASAAAAVATPPVDPAGKTKKRKNSDAGATPGPQKRAAATPVSGSGKQTPASGAKAAAPVVKAETPLSKTKVRRYENGFEVHDLAIGQPDGKAAQAGQKVTVEYVGSLQKTGKVFDQAKSFGFRLGIGEVIKGWDLGVAGMRVGDRRKLIIPPQLAYGKEGAKGAIPPNATLEFTVKLLKVK